MPWTNNELTIFFNFCARPSIGFALAQYISVLDLFQLAKPVLFDLCNLVLSRLQIRVGQGRQLWAVANILK